MNAFNEQRNQIRNAAGANNLAIMSAGGDIMNKEWAAGILKNNLDAITKSNTQTAATQAVAGGSNEALAAQKAALGNVMSNNIAQMASHGNDTDMAVMNAQLNNNNNRGAQMVAAIDAEDKRSKALRDQIISGLTGVAQTAAGAFV